MGRGAPRAPPPRSGRSVSRPARARFPDPPAFGVLCQPRSSRQPGAFCNAVFRNAPPFPHLESDLSNSLFSGLVPLRSSPCSLGPAWSKRASPSEHRPSPASQSKPRRPGSTKRGSATPVGEIDRLSLARSSPGDKYGIHARSRSNSVPYRRKTLETIVDWRYPEARLWVDKYLF